MKPGDAVTLVVATQTANAPMFTPVYMTFKLRDLRPFTTCKDCAERIDKIAALELEVLNERLSYRSDIKAIRDDHARDVQKLRDDYAAIIERLRNPHPPLSTKE